MNKSLRNLIIGIGAVSILFSIYGVIRGGEFTDALSGVIIGVALIGTAVMQQKKNTKHE